MTRKYSSKRVTSTISIILECKCECDKKEKLAIQNLHSSLTMFDEFTIKRFGDLYAWYYGDQFVRNADDAAMGPKADSEISQEIIDFEKYVLKILR